MLMKELKIRAVKLIRNAVNYSVKTFVSFGKVDRNVLNRVWLFSLGESLYYWVLRDTHAVQAIIVTLGLRCKWVNQTHRLLNIYEPIVHSSILCIVHIHSQVKLKLKPGHRASLLGTRHHGLVKHLNAFEHRCECS